MTLAEMMTSDKVFLTPAEVAPVMGCNPQRIRVMAAQAPELLPFPVVKIGSRVRIPRVLALRALGYDPATAG